MRIAVSNIAWDPGEDAAVAALLSREGIDAVDVAPSKYFPDPAMASDADIASVKTWWADRGIAVTGMQSLLFGTTGLNLFGTPETQEAMLRHLGAVCRIGGLLGATCLVFGSPRNRDRSGLSDERALELATVFFRRLGDLAAGYGVTVCLEPNPRRYGANFMTSSIETADVVKRVGSPAIRMQLDTGAMAINGESAAEVVAQCAPIIGHVHASEPDLVPLGDGNAAHAEVAKAIRERLPDVVVAIEMLATRSESHLASVERAVRVARAHYGESP